MLASTAREKIRAAVAWASDGDRLGHRSEVALAKICAGRQLVRTPKRAGLLHDLPLDDPDAVKAPSANVTHQANTSPRLR
jgi:hypothetical protein